MSFSSGFSSGAAAGGAIRDRWDDKKKRKEEIALALEREERQRQFQREQRAHELEADLKKMGFGGELDIKKMTEQIAGQKSLREMDHGFQGGENAKDRTLRVGEGEANRTHQGNQADLDRRLRADQIKRELDMRESFGNSDLALKTSELGGRLLDAGTRASKADLVQVKSTGPNGEEITRMVPPDQMPGAPTPAPLAPLTGADRTAYEAAMANPDAPGSRRALQILRGRGLIK